MRVLYDLAGADADCRFSPYCWRIKLALALKGLAADTMPVRFTEKSLIAFSGQDKVPVLRDGETVVADSMAIAAYLDAGYPDTPTLLGEGTARALTDFLRHWTERVLHARLLPLIIMDVHDALAPPDQAYFRASREARLGSTLEDYAADPAAKQAALTAALAPLDVTLRATPFIAGAAPAFADLIVFGALQWARVVRSADLIDAASPVHAWRERMLDLCGGLARRAYAASAGTG